MAWPAATTGVVERGQGEIGVVVFARGPAPHAPAPGIEIDPDGKEKPAFHGQNRRDVAHPRDVGTRRGELAIEEVWGYRVPVFGVGCDLERPAFSRAKALIALTQEEAVTYGHTPGRRPPGGCDAARGFRRGNALASLPALVGRRAWADSPFGDLVRDKLFGG